MLFLSIALSFSMMAQKTVTGVVKDDTGVTLPGVNIVLKGTTQGTITDIDGKYSIQVPGEDAILHFSYIGMQDQDIPVKGKSVINVTMSANAIAVNEVVVTGLGIKREATLTNKPDPATWPIHVHHPTPHCANLCTVTVK